jgi:hypothetical protein
VKNKKSPVQSHTSYIIVLGRKGSFYVQVLAQDLIVCKIIRKFLKKVYKEKAYREMCALL